MLRGADVRQGRSCVFGSDAQAHSQIRAARFSNCGTGRSAHPDALSIDVFGMKP
ncbi:hypothetical protein D3C72_2491480 [compost metagenome]